MNLGLLDPFESDYPEKIEEFLDHKVAKCIAFNRRGTLLAAGCADGSLVIWDISTRGVVKELVNSESRLPVTSVSWSKCGRRLLSADTEKSLILWDVARGEKAAVKQLKHPALYARLHPGMKSPSLCLVCPVSSAPLLVDFVTGDLHVLPLSITPPGSETKQTGRVKQGDLGSYASSAASFNKRGDLVYVGNSRGEILIIDTETRGVRAVVETPGGQVIKQIVFSRNGRYMLTNSADKTIRVFTNLLPVEDAASTLESWASESGETSDIEALKHTGTKCLLLGRLLKDTVNPVHWKAPCFSGDSELVVGACASKGEHKISIWNREFGHLTRVLEGPKDGLSDLAWHPNRPIVASVTMAGLVYLWARDYTESWSAFAPDFKELHENEEYVEREDEFDIVASDSEKANGVREEVDVEVDIMTNEKVAAYSDSDDSADGLYFLPSTPQRDDAVDGPVKQPSSPKPNGRSHSVSGDSPFSATNDKVKEAMDVEMGTEAHMEVEEEPEPGSPHLGEAAEQEVGPNGRTKRKRKIPEKAAEFQAEMGRKSQKKVVPMGEESDAGGSRKSQKQSQSSTPSSRLDVNDLQTTPSKGAYSDDDDDDDDFQQDMKTVSTKVLSEVTAKAVASTKVAGSVKPTGASKTTGAAPRQAGSSRPSPAGLSKPSNTSKLASNSKPTSSAKPSIASKPAIASKPTGAPRPAGDLKSPAVPKSANTSRPASAQKSAGISKLGGGQNFAGTAVSPKPAGTPRPAGAPKPSGAPKPAGPSKPAGPPKQAGLSKAGGVSKPAAGAPKPAPGVQKPAEKSAGAARPANVSAKPSGVLKVTVNDKLASGLKPAANLRLGSGSKQAGTTKAAGTPRPAGHLKITGPIKPAGPPKPSGGSKPTSGLKAAGGPKSPAEFKPVGSRLPSSTKVPSASKQARDSDSEMDPDDEDEDSRQAAKRAPRLKSVSDFTNTQNPGVQPFYKSSVIK